MFEILTNIFMILSGIIAILALASFFFFVCYLGWITISDTFWDNFKIVNGRLRRRKVRYWSFGG